MSRRNGSLTGAVATALLGLSVSGCGGGGEVTGEDTISIGEPAVSTDSGAEPVAPPVGGPPGGQGMVGGQAMAGGGAGMQGAPGMQGGPGMPPGGPGMPPGGPGMPPGGPGMQGGQGAMMAQMAGQPGGVPPAAAPPAGEAGAPEAGAEAGAGGNRGAESFAMNEMLKAASAATPTAPAPAGGADPAAGGPGGPGGFGPGGQGGGIQPPGIGGPGGPPGSNPQANMQGGMDAFLKAQRGQQQDGGEQQQAMMRSMRGGMGAPGVPGGPGGQGGFGPGGQGGFGPGGQGGPGGPVDDTPGDFRDPYKAVESFLRAAKSRNPHRLAEATALRAPQEASGKNREYFQAILDTALTQEQLDGMADSFEGYSIGGANQIKSSGSMGVIIQKAGDNGAQLSRTVYVRKEKAGWKVKDVSGVREQKQLGGNMNRRR